MRGHVWCGYLRDRELLKLCKPCTGDVGLLVRLFCLCFSISSAASRWRGDSKLDERRRRSLYIHGIRFAIPQLFLSEDRHLSSDRQEGISPLSRMSMSCPLACGRRYPVDTIERRRCSRSNKSDLCSLFVCLPAAGILPPPQRRAIRPPAAGARRSSCDKKTFWNASWLSEGFNVRV
jgi:hypothetical protein